MNYFKTLIVGCSLLLIACSASNKATTSIQTELSNAGTGRGLNYTCRISDGSIIVTTDPAIAWSPDARKADVFIEKTEYAPIDVTDLDLKNLDADKTQLNMLEEVVVIALAKQTREWPIGASRTVGVDTEAQTDLPEEERVIRMARVKTNPKTTKYARSIFTRVTASNPVVGEPVHVQKGIKGTVAYVDEKEVHVKFEPESDQPVEGPFGPVVVQDEGDHFRIEIDAKEGEMVRVGPAVGRISEVTDKYIRIDYAHPFGGESLTCETQVTAIERRVAETAQAAAVETAGGTLEGKEEKVDPRIAQPGDLATVSGTARLKSGEVVWTTRQDVADDARYKKIDGYKEQAQYGPQTILVGGEDIFPDLGDAVAGMKLGDGKNITVSAAKVFGDRNPQMMRRFDRTKMVPVHQTLPADVYVKQFGGFPVKGKEVPVNAYAVGRVVDVNEQGAVLQLSPLAEEVDSDFGLTRMQVKNDRIHIHLTPKLGADFELDNKKGIVVAVDDRQFTVDFNEPYAGENVELHIQLTGLAKASRFAGMEIEWIEDYGEGLETAEKENKPAVLVLYADWCGYCKKLFNTTLVDPRIKMMGDDVIWVKANSDKEKGLKEIYEQKGFPLTVVLDSHGDVLGSINGFRPANEYQEELKKILGSQKTALKTVSPDEAAPKS